MTSINLNDVLLVLVKNNYEEAFYNYSVMPVGDESQIKKQVSVFESDYQVNEDDEFEVVTMTLKQFLDDLVRVTD